MLKFFIATISIMHGTIEIQDGPFSREECLQHIGTEMEFVLNDDDPTNDAMCVTEIYLDGMKEMEIIWP